MLKCRQKGNHRLGKFIYIDSLKRIVIDRGCNGYSCDIAIYHPCIVDHPVWFDIALLDDLIFCSNGKVALTYWYVPIRCRLFLS